MGMDAKAYLWFGTKQLNGVPDDLKIEGLSEDTDKHAAIDIIEKKLDGTGVALVYIPSEGDSGLALAVGHTSYDHDWDNECKPFSLKEPTSDEKATLLAVAEAINWPMKDNSLGWRLGATYW